MNVVKVGLAVMSMSLVVGCSSNSKKQETAAAAPAPTAQEVAVNQMQAERDAYVRQVESKIQRYDQFASQLKSQSATTAKPLSKKMENASEDLKTATEEVREDLAEVKSAAPINWLDERRDVEESMTMADSIYASAVTMSR